MAPSKAARHTRRGRGRPRHDSAVTRDALIEAAEELFATFGVEGVSIRSIEAAAGVTTAVACYHFHSKDRLLEAVVRRRGVTVTRRTVALLDALEAGARTPTARDVVEALATPWIELLHGDPVGGLRYTRLIARLVLGQNPSFRRLNAMEGLDARFARFVRSAFPDVPEPLLERAWRIAFSVLMLMLGNTDALLGHGMDGDGTQISKEYMDTLVNFVASGFAVAVAEKRRAPKRQTSRAIRVRANGEVQATRAASRMTRPGGPP